MSTNGKIDYPVGNDDREDIHWFENYEKQSKTKHLERLKNKDILNYIKDVEQNCRFEVSSGDEDYAGTKKSSICSVRCSGTRFKSQKKIKSRVTSRKNKNIALKMERKLSSSHNAKDACHYCCSARKSYFCDNSDLIVRENSRRDLNTSNKSIYQHPNVSRNSYKYRESSPTLHAWYSRKNHKTWPAVAEIASLEVAEDWSENVIRDSRISRSKITDRKRANVRTFKSLRRNKFDESCNINICPSIAPNKKTTERTLRYYNRKHKGETRMRKLNEESGISNFENQQPLNQIYSSRDPVFLYQAPLQNGGYKGRYTSGYRYPVRRSRRPTSWGLSSRSNRLTASARLPETSLLLQGQTLQWENEGPPLKASSSITGASINRCYRRETNRKNNTNQRRRRLDILGNQESLCYRRSGLLRESGKLYEVVPTQDKQWPGCCCENAERDETADCTRYCRCPENANDLIRLQRESARRPVPMSKRVNHTAATLCKTLPKSIQSRDNDEGESEINLSMEDDSQDEDAVCDNYAFDVLDDVRTNNYDDAIDSRDLKPRASFLDDRARRGSSEVAREYREYKRLSNDLKSSRREAMGTRTALRKTITARYSADKEFSYATRTPEKPVSRDSSARLRYDAAESTCECKEPFHDPPAACSTGSCTCIGNCENAERNNGDSSRRISDTFYCCCCCSCSSSTSHDEKDPVKKLESFCERVKAVNQDIFHKPLKSTCRNTTRTNAQEYAHGDEQNQSEFSAQRAVREARSIEREWLTDPARLRLEKPKRRHNGENMEKILIYPPRGERGPPLALYKRSSNISCRVRGDANTGFRYSVTYVQKFVSPTWMPSLSQEILSLETDKECDCSADYG